MKRLKKLILSYTDGMGWDPYAGFNPLQTIGEALAEPSMVHGLADRDEAPQGVLQMLEKVGLIPPEDFYMRRLYHLSCGQLQRAAITRATLLEPQLIVADEPTSNLDTYLLEPLSLN